METSFNIFSFISFNLCHIFFFMLALMKLWSKQINSNPIPYTFFSVLSVFSLCVPSTNWTGQTPHQCDVCGKKYTRKEHLANHMRSHTNETPFRCEICGKSFSRKEHFTNHILWHTGKETKQSNLIITNLVPQNGDHKTLYTLLHTHTHFPPRAH